MNPIIPGKVYKHKWTPVNAVVMENKNGKVKVEFMNGRKLTLPVEHFYNNFEPDPVGEIWNDKTP